MKWQLFNEINVSINSAIELPGNFIVGVGDITSHEEGKVRIIKTDGSGKILFEKEYGMGEYTYSSGTGIESFSSNNFIITANCMGYGDVVTNQWAWLLVTELNGDTLWTQILNNTYSNTQSGQLNSIGKLSDNQYYAAGWFHKQPDYNWDFWITKFRLDTTINGINFEKESKEIEPLMLKQNYPNPFNNSCKIEYLLFTHTRVKIELFDILGLIFPLIFGQREKPVY
jgi:hypothetical protein